MLRYNHITKGIWQKIHFTMSGYFMLFYTAQLAKYSEDKRQHTQGTTCSENKPLRHATEIDNLYRRIIWDLWDELCPGIKDLSLKFRSHRKKMSSHRTTVPNDTHSLPLQLNVMPPPCWMPCHTLKSPHWPFQFFQEHWFEKSTNCPDHDFGPHNALISIIITINHSHFVIHVLLVPFHIFHNGGKVGMIFEFIFLFPVCLNLRLTHKISAPIGI